VKCHIKIHYFGNFIKPWQIAEFGVHMVKECNHTWYMRELGIQCTKCLVLWKKQREGIK
jgi:hypothetical protein